MKKVLLSFGGIALALMSVIIFGNSTQSAAIDDGNLHLYMFDVGQGDALFVQTPEVSMIVDGGPDSTVIYELGKALPFYEHEIDYMVLSHPHNDHVNGLNDVIDRYAIGTVFHSGVIHTLPSYIAWLQRLKDNAINTHIISGITHIELADNTYIEFFAPQEDFSGEEVDSLNNSSLVFKLTYKDTSYLFTGDMEEELEDELINSGVDLSADVLKVGHHGSVSSTSEPFLNAVSPEVALISAPPDSRYGHPHDETIELLAEYNIEIFRTDQEGTVHLVSDGINIWEE